MTDPQPMDYDFRSARDLTLSLIEGRLRADEMDHLESLILSRADIRRYYIRMMHVHASLHQHASILGPAVRLDEDLGGGSLNDAIVVSAIREEADEPPALLTARKIARTPVSQPPPAPWWQGRGPWWRLGSIAALIAIGIGVWTTWQRPVSPAFPDVAIAPAEAAGSVTASAGADLAARRGPLKDGDHLASGEPLVLSSGVVEIGLAQHGRLICQGPAQFTVDSPRHVSLQSGKLVARIKGGGLVVQTPAMTITDLGTEFGIAVGSNGTTDLTVFEGSVRVSAPNAPSSARILTAGEAVTCAPATAPVTVAAATIASQFLRAMPGIREPLDLVDIFEGGDGTEHHRGWGLDPLTGQYIGPDEWPGSPRLAGALHQFPRRSRLDSCVIAAPAGTPTPIDSRGDAFAFANSNTTVLAPIWAGGVLPAIPGGRIDLVVAGVNYAVAGHGMLLMHANSVITFNLDPIRAADPAHRAMQFRATLAKPPLLSADGADRSSTLNGYVLIDGSARVFRSCSARQTPFAIDLLIDANAHFLTLATSGASSAPGDAVLFGDPILIPK